MKVFKKIFVSVLFVSLLTFTGCGVLEDVLNKFNDDQTEENNANETIENRPNEATKQNETNENNEKEENNETYSPNELEGSIIYASNNHDKLSTPIIELLNGFHALATLHIDNTMKEEMISEIKARDDIGSHIDIDALIEKLFGTTGDLPADFPLEVMPYESFINYNFIPVGYHDAETQINHWQGSFKVTQSVDEIYDYYHNILVKKGFEITATDKDGQEGYAIAEAYFESNGMIGEIPYKITIIINNMLSDTQDGYNEVLVEVKEIR